LFSKVLVANRGEIAVRIIRTCRDLGIRTVAVHSLADAGALHVRLADEAVSLGGETAADSYLRIDRLLDAVASSGADAVHPGYGFLSEQAEFADAIAGIGAAFVGPGGEAIRAMGDKVSSRAIAQAAGVPIVPGTDVLTAPEPVVALGETHGWPIAIKASFGGGGRGMRIVDGPAGVAAALEAAQAEALAGFGRSECYAERYLSWPRHVEVQILADQSGNVVCLGERDCSVQRRHQKLIEEAPAVGLDPQVRADMAAAAVAIARQCHYVNAGTVEMLYQNGEFYFLEMNTRLQVEHPVTELTYGIDLVEQQLRVAAGEALAFTQSDLASHGHAIELRINAERVESGRFVPTPGRVEILRPPVGPGVRWDGGYESGDEVGSNFDNLIGKLVVWAPNRETALGRARRALAEFDLRGVSSTAHVQRTLLNHQTFIEDAHSTRWLEEQVQLEDDEPPTTTAASADGGDGDELERLWIGGRTYVLPGADVERLQPSARRRSVGAVPASSAGGPRPHRGQGGGQSSGSVRSPMQGTVVKILVKAGDTVVAGETVCVVEAMKMQNSLSAGVSGTVVSVDVQVGASVTANQQLVKIAAKSDGSEVEADSE
jgi:acetyl-CoA/propionyl-CoA carboxylase biotin carboxyl carrier protein